jgi:hypothetical protein
VTLHQLGSSVVRQDLESLERRLLVFVRLFHLVELPRTLRQPFCNRLADLGRRDLAASFGGEMEGGAGNAE